MRTLITLVAITLSWSLPSFAGEGSCSYNLVHEYGYSIEYAQKTCALSECGYNLVHEYRYSIEDAQKTCAAKP